MLHYKLAFCFVLILDVVKKVDVKHSFNWDNDFVSKYYHGHLNKI